MTCTDSRSCLGAPFTMFLTAPGLDQCESVRPATLYTPTETKNIPYSEVTSIVRFTLPLKAPNEETQWRLQMNIGTWLCLLTTDPDTAMQTGCTAASTFALRRSSESTWLFCATATLRTFHGNTPLAVHAKQRRNQRSGSHDDVLPCFASVVSPLDVTP